MPDSCSLEFLEFPLSPPTSRGCLRSFARGSTLIFTSATKVAMDHPNSHIAFSHKGLLVSEPLHQPNINSPSDVILTSSCRHLNSQFPSVLNSQHMSASLLPAQAYMQPFGVALGPRYPAPFVPAAHPLLRPATATYRDDSLDNDDSDSRKMSKSARRRQRRRMLRQHHMQTQLSAAVSHCLTDDDEFELDETNDNESEDALDHVLAKSDDRANLSDSSSSSSTAHQIAIDPTSSGLPCTWQISPNAASPTTCPSSMSFDPPQRLCTAPPCSPAGYNDERFKSVIDLGLRMHSQGSSWLRL
jgi:hypothetical protein